MCISIILLLFASTFHKAQAIMYTFIIYSIKCIPYSLVSDHSSSSTLQVQLLLKTGTSFRLFFFFQHITTYISTLEKRSFIFSSTNWRSTIILFAFQYDLVCIYIYYMVYSMRGFFFSPRGNRKSGKRLCCCCAYITLLLQYCLYNCYLY